MSSPLPRPLLSHTLSAVSKKRDEMPRAGREQMGAWGRQGGKPRWEGVSPEQRTELARKAAIARWKGRVGQ